MKNLKQIYIALLLISVLLLSCKKEEALKDIKEEVYSGQVIGVNNDVVVIDNDDANVETESYNVGTGDYSVTFVDSVPYNYFQFNLNYRPRYFRLS